MRLQLPTIIVLCFAVILVITLIYDMGVEDDGTGGKCKPTKCRI